MMEYLANILASNFFKSHCDNHSTLQLWWDTRGQSIYWRDKIVI